VYGVHNPEDFDEPRGESTAYSPNLVEVGAFSEDWHTGESVWGLSIKPGAAAARINVV
jgi:hypothetical protein